MNIRHFLAAIFLVIVCQGYGQVSEEVSIIVLGTAQDGGYPHIGCEKECCNLVWENPEMRRYVVSLAITDPISNRWYLFEATPDIREQISLFRVLTGGRYNYLPDAIFVSHAHTGHYTGLAQFGREVMNTSMLTVYALPRMKNFLEENGPWSQLVRLNNIALPSIWLNGELSLSENISIKLLTVPHRDEYSETAGYIINTNAKDYLFIPDIDKWERWNRDIVHLVKGVDIAFLDGTFYTIDELPGRDISEIPHPFITESIELFSSETAETKSKIHFIHFNHSNPVLWNNAGKSIRGLGFNIAQQGKWY